MSADEAHCSFRFIYLVSERQSSSVTDKRTCDKNISVGKLSLSRERRGAELPAPARYRLNTTKLSGSIIERPVIASLMLPPASLMFLQSMHTRMLNKVDYLLDRSTSLFPNDDLHYLFKITLIFILGEKQQLTGRSYFSDCTSCSFLYRLELSVNFLL